MGINMGSNRSGIKDDFARAYGSLTKGEGLCRSILLTFASHSCFKGLLLQTDADAKYFPDDTFLLNGNQILSARFEAYLLAAFCETFTSRVMHIIDGKTMRSCQTSATLE